MSTEKQNPFSKEVTANLEALRKNPYPGRGIIMGLNNSGEHAVQVYWVMGRSDNSRNRLLVREEESVKTVPFDASKVKDPSLIIYNAIRVIGDKHVVSNGDQTDTVVETIQKGGSFEDALLTRTFEPDKPNNTSRISGMIALKPLRFNLSRIAVDQESPSVKEDPTPRHDFFSPVKGLEVRNGIGVCVHTYKGDGNPLPTFYDEPYPVPLVGKIDDIANLYWDVLSNENKVAMVVKTIDLLTGQTNFRIKNKLSK